MAYTYRFIDKDNKIIYIGKTVNIDRRMAEHFGGKGHLAKQCYNETCKIEYQTWKTESDALIMEQYYIAKVDPKYNKLGKSRDVPSIVIEEKEWKLYRQIRSTKEPVKLTWNWFSIAWLMFLIYTIIQYLINIVK